MFTTLDFYSQSADCLSFLLCRDFFAHHSPDFLPLLVAKFTPVLPWCQFISREASFCTIKRVSTIAAGADSWRLIRTAPLQATQEAARRPRCFRKALLPRARRVLTCFPTRRSHWIIGQPRYVSYFTSFKAREAYACRLYGRPDALTQHNFP